MQLLLVFGLVLLGACGTVLLKIGAERVSYVDGLLPMLLTAVRNAPLVCGFILQMIPLVSWVVLLKFMPLTKLQPMIALTYVVTPVLAVLFLGEHIGPLRMAGIGLIVLGVVLVSAS
ncbi:EamA family transporter [Stenotrophomonas maltophilia]|uniref:EamA family transporter n=1 Tax=uncultured Stenotrophomonas sp. TaxID=165438 RepID=UPI001D10109E|nr:EamA family transporter [Stenotrophomonas geniculata]UXB16571.1 EamA family transporter [Stenotrophomonas maltophilia]